MNFYKFLISTVLVVTVVGCGKGNSENSEDVTTSKTTVLENGETYEHYYNQFVFAAKPCNPKGYRYYKFTASSSASSVSSKQNRYFNLDVYMLPSSAYIAKLVTLKPRPDISSEAYESVDTYELSGNWYVDKERLILAGLGVGDAIMYNDHPAIQFKLGPVFKLETLDNSETFLIKVSSDSVPYKLQQSCN